MKFCDQCRQRQQKYKVLQADLEFQIKKTKEDLALEKVLMEQQYQKQSKRMLEKIQKEVGERAEENRKWLAKYDLVVEQYQMTIMNITNEYQEKQKHLEDLAAQRYSKKEQQIKIRFDNTVSTLENSHQAREKEMKSRHETESRKILEQKVQQERTAKQKHFQEIEEITYDYDRKIKHLKQEVTNETQNLNKLKLESHLKQTSLYQQLYQRKQEINDLKYQVEKLNTNIKTLQQQIKHKCQQIQVLVEKHKQAISHLQSEYRIQKQSIIDEFNDKIQALLRNKLDDCIKFEQVVRQIQQKRQTEIKLYETSLKEVKELVVVRPSREEDVEQIISLKQMLNCKQKQFQKVLNQVKGYRLELNNKEEMFNKIFGINNMNSTTPLNIERIGKKKDLKLARGSSNSIIKQVSRYHSTINTIQAISTLNDFAKKQKLIVQPKSTKMF